MEENRMIVGIPAGSVEYSKDDAAVDIDEMIETLQSLKDDGATHVVGLSGNYRGARYVRLGTADWLDDEQ